MEVTAVVVTYNRADLLEACLDAVAAQTRRPDRVIVVDNASTDRTPDVLAARAADIEVLRLATNEGSSGGFREGVLAGMRTDAEWLWLMDDDTIPVPDALERLLAHADGTDRLPAPSLLASRVVWTNGLVHPMNPPVADLRDHDRLVFALDAGLLPVRTSTFPSLLVRRDAVERHGPPRAGFFIWSDDQDFTGRILKSEPGFWVNDSVAEHRTKTAHMPHQGGERFYYAVRNGLFLLRGDAFTAREKILRAVTVVMQIGMFLGEERWRPRAWRVVARGLRDGIAQPVP